jgi:hypothetical protein
VIGTYASAILICISAVLLGRAVCALAGHAGSTWLSAPVGFAVLMIVCQVAIKLPGRAWTAVAAVVVLSAAAVWIAVRRRAGWPSMIDGVPVAIVVLVYLSVPFLANGRVGVLGVSLLNDMRHHLLLAESLRRPEIQQAIGGGYPLGPHAVAATLAQGLGSDVDKTLTGVLVATPVLTALAALEALRDISRLRRWLVAVLAGIAYLMAAWYIQSAFKEPIMALLLLGVVVALQAGSREGFARPAVVAVPVAVLIAGVIYDFSYPGLTWPFAVLVCWVAAEILLGGAWRRVRPVLRALRSAAWPLLLSLLLLILLVAPDIGQLHAFWLTWGGTKVGTVGGISTSALENLAAPLRTLEGLNIWLSGDFRFVPSDQLKAGLLCGIALMVLVYAVVSALQRHDRAWPAAALGVALVYVYVRHTQSPYVAAKALIVPAPLLAVGSGGALMRRLDVGNWCSFATLAVAAVAMVFFVFSFQSTYLVLADGFVGPTNHIAELRSLRRLLHDRPTLVLFYDDFYQWELLGVPASSPVVSGTAWSRPAAIQPAKPWSFGQPIDFDSVDATTLDRFDYVITTRTTAQSAPPPNFHLVGSSASYEVWKRVGATPSHLVLPESGTFGAILNCRTASGRRISHETGLARVRPAPRYFRAGVLVPGSSEPIRLKLPPGRWDISMPFTSPQSVSVRGSGLDVTLPPNLDRVGEIWPVGQVQSSGSPVVLTMKMANPGEIRENSQYFIPQTVIAVPVAPERSVPLRAACGRYIDWYKLT